MAKGKLIVLEGLDGAGITTHTELLKNWLRDEQGVHKIHQTKEPTKGPIGSLIRLILEETVKIQKRPDTLALLYAADRMYQMYNESYGTGREAMRQGIVKALEEGYYVISDRYVFSSYAYQGVPVADASVDIEWLKQVNKYVRMPDLAIFLDVPADICLERIGRERAWRYQLLEQVDDMGPAYREFKKIFQELKAEGKNVLTVQGTSGNQARPIGEVQEDIRRAVKELLDRKG